MPYLKYQIMKEILGMESLIEGIKLQKHMMFHNN